MAKDQPAGFGDFILSLLPLMAMVGVGLGSLHLISDEMPIFGAILLTFLSLIPLSIGPLFLMLVAYGKGMPENMFPIAISFNHLRFKLVLPVFLLVIGWMFDLLPNFPFLIWAGLGAIYFVFCLWLTAGLVSRELSVTRSYSFVFATGALCLAIL
jgi:hypothetical protein